MTSGSYPLLERPRDVVAAPRLSRAGALHERWADARVAVAMGLILLLALALRLYDLGEEPLWIDEAATYRFASAPLHLMWGEAAARETNPPLYATLIRWLVLSWSSSEAALRLPSALLGVASVGLAFAIGRVTGGVRLGLCSALLLATAANHVGVGQEARAYALLIFAALLATLGLVQLLRDPRAAAQPLWRARPTEGASARGAWAMYFLGAALALWSHNTAVLLPVVASLLVLPAALGARGSRRGLLTNWTIVNLLVLAVWCWWIPRIVEQSVYTLNDAWHMPLTTWASAEETIRAGIGQRQLGRLRDVADLTMLVLLGIGLWTAWRVRPLRVPAAFAVGVPAAILLIGFWKPIVVYRAMYWPAAMVWIVIAAGVLALPRPWIRIAALTLLVTLNLRAVAAYHVHVHKDDWPAVVADLRPQPGDAIVILSEQAEFAMQYYARHVLQSTPTYVHVPGGDGRLAPWLVAPCLNEGGVAPTLAGYRRLWVVVAVKPRLGTFDGRLREMGFVQQASFGRYKAFGYLYGREASAAAGRAAESGTVEAAP